MRLGGRFSQMFLVANVDEAKVEAALKDFGHGIDYLNVQAARQTTRDMKGPYCATSPLVPFVRHARLTVPWKRGIVDEVTEFLNKNGVTVTDLDEYRAGKDVVLEGFAHLPASSPFSPRCPRGDLLQSMERHGGEGPGVRQGNRPGPTRERGGGVIVARKNAPIVRRPSART